MLLLVGIAAAGADAQNRRVQARAGGGDRDTALRVADALLAQTLPVQLLRVRCERYEADRFCGLVLSGVKFHQRVDTASFEGEVDDLVHRAFAVDPAIAEVDLWVTVPLDAGKGSVVTGDFAQQSMATVFATTVKRKAAARPSEGPDVFWDPAFARQLAAGSPG